MKVETEINDERGWFSVIFHGVTFEDEVIHTIGKNEGGVLRTADVTASMPQDYESAEIYDQDGGEPSNADHLIDCAWEEWRDAYQPEEQKTGEFI